MSDDRQVTQGWGTPFFFIEEGVWGRAEIGAMSTAATVIGAAIAVAETRRVVATSRQGSHDVATGERAPRVRGRGAAGRTQDLVTWCPCGLGSPSVLWTPVEFAPTL